MQSLFENKLYPITAKMAFIRGNINTITKEFLTWQEPLISKHNNSFSKNILNESLEKVLLSLCPLTTAERRRYLFIPTIGDWVAFLDNGHTGTDRTAPEVLGKKLSAETVYFSCDLKTEETVFDYFGKTESGIDLLRSIATVNEGGWKFYQYGNVLPFEKVENYKSRQIKKRFDPVLLIEYLKALGIDAFNESFYQTPDVVLLNKIGPKFDNTKELTIQQAQTWFA